MEEFRHMFLIISGVPGVGDVGLASSCTPNQDQAGYRREARKRGLLPLENPYTNSTTIANPAHVMQAETWQRNLTATHVQAHALPS